MARNHIHFSKGMPGDNGVISGMRQSCTVIIEIDMEKAMNNGIKFYKSKNDVILSPGEGENGILKPQYFKSVKFRDEETKIYKTVFPKTFEHLLVLDFEANCVEGGKLECQEIIEFPVVAINMATKSVEIPPFHFYIKPSIVP